MTTFVAVYRGASVSDARLIAVSADPAIVADVSARILRAEAGRQEADPIVAPIDRARRRALRLVRREVSRSPERSEGESARGRGSESGMRGGNEPEQGGAL